MRYSPLRIGRPWFGRLCELTWFLRHPSGFEYPDIELQNVRQVDGLIV